MSAVRAGISDIMPPIDLPSLDHAPPMPSEHVRPLPIRAARHDFMRRIG
ncbi:hypothetical protein [Kitasatospora purpeofusca]